MLESEMLDACTDDVKFVEDSSSKLSATDGESETSLETEGVFFSDSVSGWHDGHKLDSDEAD